MHFIMLGTMFDFFTSMLPAVSFLYSPLTAQQLTVVDVLELSEITNSYFLLRKKKIECDNIHSLSTLLGTPC